VIKVILYRHKEPEIGLDCSKGFTLSFFEGEEEVATLTYEVEDKEDGTKR